MLNRPANIGERREELRSRARMPMVCPAVDEEALTAPLYQTIGRLKVEADFLKKKC